MLKTGLYEVFGNAVEYFEGEQFGYDLDSREDIPTELIEAIGVYKERRFYGNGKKILSQTNS